MDKPSAGIRKRQQIKQANRMMLIWVAGASVIVGISIVIMVFLIQKIVFGEKVIFEKNKTVSVLEKNLNTVNDLRDNIRVLNTNKDLSATRLNDGGEPIQSVLDALPADANSTALASSLQTKLLAGVPGIVIETINVVPVDGLETSAAGSVQTGGTVVGSNEISFTFSVSADASNYSALRQVLERLEKSIRPFNVLNLSVEGQGKRVVMTATGVSYYNPAKTVDLTNKVVKS
jgi:hypothetical protein